MTELHDPHLRRALDHAPDHEAAPGPHTRDAILKIARNALTPAPVAGPVLPWWRRWLGATDRGPRMPWNAVLATVLVAGIAGLLWRHEPIPDARLDGEAQVSQKERVEQAAPPASASETVPPPQSAASAPTPAPAAPASPAPLPRPAAPAPSTPKPTPAAPPAVAPRDAAAGRAKSSADESERKATQRLEEATQRPLPAPVQPVAPPPVIADARPPGAPPMAAAAPAPTAPTAPFPAEALRAPVAPSAGMPSAESDGPPAAARGSARMQAPAARLGAAAPSPLPSPAAGLQSNLAETPFAALSLWTHITVVPTGGPGRGLTRGEARSLTASLDSAARAAINAEPLGASVEWRLTLERDGEVLAVLELAGDQVRWRESGAAFTRTGQPAPGVMQSLRTTLARLAEAR